MATTKVKITETTDPLKTWAIEDPIFTNFSMEYSKDEEGNTYVQFNFNNGYHSDQITPSTVVAIAEFIKKEKLS